MTNLKLYHNGPSTCSQKVRLILGLKELEYESKHIDLISGEQHDPEYVKLNPNHVVPTLISGDNVLIESSLILEFLEDSFSEISARPKDPGKAHFMRLWMKYMDNFHQFVSGVLTYGLAGRHLLLQKTEEDRNEDINKIPDPLKRETRRILVEQGIDAPIVAEALKRAMIFLNKLENEIPVSGWLSGDSFGLADACVLPYILRMQQLNLDEAFNSSDKPKIHDWYLRTQDLPFYDSSVTELIPAPFSEMFNTFSLLDKDKALSIMKG